MARFVKYFTVSSAASFHVVSAANVSGWSPNANDSIIVTPYLYDPNQNVNANVENANVKFWNEYDASLNSNNGGYKIHVSDSQWTGTFYLIIQTP